MTELSSSTYSLVRALEQELVHVKLQLRTLLDKMDSFGGKLDITDLDELDDLSTVDQIEESWREYDAIRLESRILTAVAGYLHGRIDQLNALINNATEQMLINYRKHL